jgi:hypothetical protein
MMGVNAAGVVTPAALRSKLHKVISTSYQVIDKEYLSIWHNRQNIVKHNQDIDKLRQAP